MMISMPAPELDSLARQLATDTRLRQAFVFGSVAAGRAGTDSDLDLAVDLGRPITEHERMGLISEVALLSGRPIDLIDLHAVGEPLLGQILRNGRRLIGSRAEFGNLIARHFTESADFLPLRRRIQNQRRRAWIGM